MSNNTHTQMPGWLAAEAAEYRHRNPARRVEVDRDIRPGDIRRCIPVRRHPVDNADARLVYVQAVHDKHVVVALVHSMPEWATSNDLVLSPSTVTGWPLVVQRDMVGCAYPDQIATLIARMPEGWEADAVPGLHLSGPLEARWRFKEGELDSLDALLLETWWELTEG